MNLASKLKGLWRRVFGVRLMIKRKGWRDITVGQYLELVAAGDKLTLAEGLRIVYGVDIREVPVSAVSRYSLEFLKEEPKRSPIKKEYTLNGRRYAANFDTTRMTTAQFVDFQNYTKAEDFVGALSVCLRPVGHDYNDGYSIEEVKADIMAMPIVQALTIAFFFKNQLVILLNATLSSSAEVLQSDPTMKMFAAIIEWAGLQSSAYCQ